MNRKSPLSNSHRSGFTLIELLLVMAILVILASIGSVAYLNYMRNARSDIALITISDLESQCKAYKLQVGNFPVDLNDLYQQPAGLNKQQWRGPYLEKPVPLDPWGKKYNYSRDEANNRVFIQSFGPDGMQGTDDDVPEIQKSGNS